jgi:hypothetical protein
MANFLTRVPDDPLPRLGAPARAVLPAADLAMWLMASRPATGSLANTWVTPATLALCALTAAASVLLIALLIASGAAALPRGLWIALLAIAAGACLSIMTVGVSQRIARPS